MWERHLKNEFGQLKTVTKGKSYIETDILSPNGTYNYNPANIDVKYIVESLDKRNEKAFEESQLVGSKVNPWELNDQFFTDSFGTAIHELLIRTFDSDTVHEPQLTMYIKDNNGNEAEVTAYLPSTTRNSIRNLVEKETNDKINWLSRELETYMNELETMREFIKKYNAEELYRKFKEGGQKDAL